MQEPVTSVSLMCLIILLLIFLFKKLRQPYLVAYIVAGVLLGPHVSGIISNSESIASLGEFGILLLMFFLGIEIEIPERSSFIVRPLVAQLVKTALGILLAVGIGAWLHWPVGNVLLFSAALLFNSTAIVSEFLKRRGELQTGSGKMVLNILLLQDVMLAPVLTLFQVSTGGYHLQPARLLLSLAGCLLMGLLLRAIRNRNLFQLPLIKELNEDHELQVFAGAFICFGFAELASLAGLSGAIGSFAAGVYIGRTHAFHWLESVLKPFKVFFTALFFLSLGLSLDVRYLLSHYTPILALVLCVLVLNSILSALVFRLLRYRWNQSLYAGALLSQTGEFGLLAATLAYNTHLVDEAFFKTMLAVTILSLLFSTLWMSGVRNFVLYKKRRHRFVSGSLPVSDKP